MRGCRYKLAKPLPSGPFGDRIAIRRGAFSSIEWIELINVMRVRLRSERAFALS